MSMHLMRFVDLKIFNIFANENRLKHVIVFVCLALLFMLSRLVFLDCDSPPAVISSYIPIDEFYYTMPGFNLYQFGETIHSIVPDIMGDLQPTNILENIVTAITLSIFGNNYYGLRMSSAFSALLVFILTFLVLWALIIDNGAPKNNIQIQSKSFDVNAFIIIYACMAYLLFDFSFLIAGRVAEPTIFRMLAMVILIYITTMPFAQGPLTNKWYSVFFGFIGMAAVAFVYIYNLFIFGALAVSVFFWAQKRGFRNTLQQIAFFTVGSMLCIVVYQLVAVMTYHSSLYEVYMHMVPFSGRMTGDLVGIDMLFALISNFMIIFLTNIFRYNPVLLFLFLLSLPVFLWRVLSYRNNTEIFLLNLLIFLGAQSVVINDYPMRKLIILLPLVIIIIGVAGKYIIEYLHHLGSKPRGTVHFRSYVVFVLAISVVVAVVYMMPSISDVASLTSGLGLVNLLVLLFVGLVTLGILCHSLHIPRYLIMMLIVVTFASNIYMDCVYVFMNRTYYFQDAMKAMGSRTNGQVIVGGCGYGFRLYNTSKPVLDAYIYKYGVSQEQKDKYDDDFEDLISEGIGAYSIAYLVDIPGSAIGMDYMDKHGMILVEKYEMPDHLGADIGLFAFRK